MGETFMIPMELTKKNIEKLSEEQYVVVSTLVSSYVRAQEELSIQDTRDIVKGIFDKYDDAFSALAK